MEEATKHKLSVIAFEGLPTRMQAKLFVDINAEQKSVKQNLLRELYAELRWDDEDPETRVSAIVSKAIQDIAIDPESPFFRRILLSDEQKTSDCCITLDSMAKALEKPGFFITIKKDIPKYDPLWRPDSLQCLKRTKSLLNGWFLILSTKADSWWRLGSGEGGGLAMNDGITICINVLRSVFKHLEDQGINLVQIDDQELLNCVNPYAEILGEYFYNLSEEKRKAFRSLRGVQGQTTGTKRCQVAINEKKPSFNPPGLKEFIETEKLETNKKAKEIIDRIERLTQETVIEELKSNYGEEDEKWWLNGVPRVVRTEATNRYEQDDGKRGGKEYYLDLIHYRKIIMEHWDLFESIFGYGEKSGKEKRTKWLADINDIRRVVAHSSAGAQVEPEKINELEEYERWLMLKTAGSDEFSQLQ